MQSTINRPRNVQHAKFKAHTRYNAKQSDFTEDAYSAKIVVFHVQRFWNLDLSKVTLSGYTTDEPNMRNVLGVNVRTSGGEIIREAEFDCPFAAYLEIQVDEGCEWSDAIRLDLSGDLQVQYLERMGFPDDFPCGSEVIVKKDMSVTFTITPLL